MENMEKVQFDEDNRKIFNGITFVLPKVKTSNIKARIRDLSNDDRQQCKAAMLRRDSYDVSRAVMKIYADSQFRHPMFIRYIDELNNSEEKSVPLSDGFSVVVEMSEMGTRTRISTEDGYEEFMWGNESIAGQPDVIQASISMLESVYDTTSSEVKPLVPTVAKNIKDYHPDGVECVSKTYFDFVSRGGSKYVGDNIRDLVIASPVITQVVTDLVSMSPKLVDGLAAHKADMDDNYNIPCQLFKGELAIHDSTVDDKDFVANTIKATRLAASIGSPKKGFGKMRHYHYDGISSLSPIQRKKYEFLTDFVRQPAQVYFVDTKDEDIAYSLAREIKDYAKDNFLVVYEKKGLGDFSEYCDFDKVTLQKTGVIGCTSTVWLAMFEKYDTYYISFKQPIRSGGSGRKQIDTMYATRQIQHNKASKYGKFMYYGFIGAMGEKDFVWSSCRGRDTRVVFTNEGVLDRTQAMHSILMYVRHCLLYPFLRDCYQKRHGAFHVYPGIRGFNRRYDLSPPRSDEFD